MNSNLLQALKSNHLPHDVSFVTKLEKYLHLLQTWNRVFNLTSITHLQDMIYLHIIDSLIIHPFLKGQRYLDVGSGAGLPGLPLALLNPKEHWTLLDKNNKKTRFLIQVCAELNLKNIDVVHQRCEDFHPEACFDSIVSRAFASTSQFIKLTQHLLCPGGQWVAMKGKYSEKEKIELGNLKETIIPLSIHGRNLERHLLIFTYEDTCG